jgi:flagellar basal-body rod modification protein FlgD
MSELIQDITKYTQPQSQDKKKTASEQRREDVSKNKDAFLQMMVAQLKNQDPMSPVENQDFLAQMAQFTSVEEIQSLTASSAENSEKMNEGITKIADVLAKMQADTASFQKTVKEGLESIQESLKEGE